jgi:hypothetical protein
MRSLLALIVIAIASASCTSGTHAPTDRIDARPSIASGMSAAAPEKPVDAAERPAPTCPPPPPPTRITDKMRVDDFIDALAARIDALDPAPLDAELAPIAARHGLDAASPHLRRDFARLRTLFEATRDGGFWRLRWAITNEEPSSKRIWSQWATNDLSDMSDPSATAECDELSALTAFLAHELDVERVGLYWPTWNHTIVAWEPKGTTARVLVPTTQIFLECDDGIDATTFSGTAQKKVYPYAAKDVSGEKELSAQTATFLLAQIDRYAPASRDVLALIRLHRAHRLKSSVGRCEERRAELAEELEGHLSCADRDALLHYWTSELGEDVADPAVIVRALAAPK